jgi:RNA polymerase sigma-70 factor (ECF subfamily)
MEQFRRMDPLRASTLAPGLAELNPSAERATSVLQSPEGSHSDVNGVADMVRRARADPQNFGELYDAYFPRIYGYVATRLRSRVETEDVVADTFVRALDNLPRFEYRGTGSFAAWLFRIARNRLLDEQEERKRLSSLDPPPARVHARALDAPATAVEQSEEARLIRDLIGSLPPRRQEVVALKFFGGLRNIQIAEVIGVDQRTVASHLCRALDELRSKYMAAMNVDSGGS